MPEDEIIKRVFALEEKYGEPMTRKAWDDILFKLLDECFVDFPDFEKIQQSYKWMKSGGQFAALQKYKMDCEEWKKKRHP